MFTVGVVVLLFGVAGVLFAVPIETPEIDSASGANALALLSGALLVLRSRGRE